MTRYAVVEFPRIGGSRRTWENLDGCRASFISWFVRRNERRITLGFAARLILYKHLATRFARLITTEWTALTEELNRVS